MAQLLQVVGAGRNTGLLRCAVVRCGMTEFLHRCRHSRPYIPFTSCAMLRRNNVCAVPRRSMSERLCSTDEHTKKEASSALLIGICSPKHARPDDLALQEGKRGSDLWVDPRSWACWANHMESSTYHIRNSSEGCGNKPHTTTEECM